MTVYFKTKSLPAVCPYETTQRILNYQDQDQDLLNYPMDFDAVFLNIESDSRKRFLCI
jgi:hypothetical protein